MLSVMPIRILLDCDPGHDDVVAIIAAAHYADLVGITTVAGNAPLDRTTYNACVMRDLLGLSAPVHAGAVRPLLAEPHPAAFVHGESGLDGADLPAPGARGRRRRRGRLHHRHVPRRGRAVAGADRAAHEHRAGDARRARSDESRSPASR